jgi:hypothetical protein
MPRAKTRDAAAQHRAIAVRNSEPDGERFDVIANAPPRPESASLHAAMRTFESHARLGTLTSPCTRRRPVVFRIRCCIQRHRTIGRRVDDCQARHALDPRAPQVGRACATRGFRGPIESTRFRHVQEAPSPTRSIRCIEHGITCLGWRPNDAGGYPQLRRGHVEPFKARQRRSRLDEIARAPTRPR